MIKVGEAFGKVAWQSLASSRSNENEACQLQQDNKGFTFEATGRCKLNFACDFMFAGNGAAAQAANHLQVVGRIITVPLQLFEFNLILWTTRKPVTSEMFWWCWWAPS